jgi:hypothetical protein
MDIAISVIGIAMVALFFWFMHGVFEQDGATVFVVGLLMVVLAIPLVGLSIASWNANGERLAREAAACTEAGNLWAHDEEACITPDGWTIDVR